MKKRILIAEDNRIIALDIRRQLQNLDYEVVSMVATGEDAIVKSRNHKPDAVLMDIKLQGKMTGIEAGSVIYDELNIPIIHLTGSGHHVFEGKLKYPLVYLAKPFQKKDLQEVLNKTLSI